MRIIFWGTPEFAVPSLHALLGEGHDLVAVVTQPDRPAGRGRSVRKSAVKLAAEEERIPVLQPEHAYGAEFVSQLRELAPEVSVVIAYGQILKQEVLLLPERGSINAHASLLPELRGAAPINWAIVRGYEQTGVTIIRMVERMDAGPVLFQVEEPIVPEETAADLRVRLSEISAEALVETLALMEAAEITEREQDESRVTFAPRITREHARIDWSQDAAALARLVRGMDSDPGAWTTLDGNELKLFRPVPLPEETREQPGTVLEVHSLDPTEGMVVATGKGVLALREVQPAGKRRMLAAEWLRGRGARTGDRLGS